MVSWRSWRSCYPCIPGAPEASLSTCDRGGGQSYDQDERFGRGARRGRRIIRFFQPADPGFLVGKRWRKAPSNWSTSLPTPAASLRTAGSRARQAALRETEKALSAAPQNAEAQLTWPMPAYTSTSLEEARVLGLPLRSNRPKPTHYLLGYAHSECKRRDEAKWPPRRLRLSPEELVYLRAYAELLVDLRRLEEAPQDRGRKPSPSGRNAHPNHITLGYVSSSMGDRIRAKACYQQALSIEPNNAPGFEQSGLCRSCAGSTGAGSPSGSASPCAQIRKGRAAKPNLKLVEQKQPRDHLQRLRSL